MAQRVTLGNWGGNVAMRLPRDAARAAGFSAGTTVEIEARAGELVIRATRPRYTLAQLLAGTTPEAMRDAFEWGPDVGREKVR